MRGGETSRFLVTFYTIYSLLVKIRPFLFDDVNFVGLVVPPYTSSHFLFCRIFDLCPLTHKQKVVFQQTVQVGLSAKLGSLLRTASCTTYHDTHWLGHRLKDAHHDSTKKVLHIRHQ